MNLHQPLHVLPGVGPKSAEKYAKLGIENLQDLLLYFPFRYEDFKTKQVLELEDGEKAVLSGQALSCRLDRVRSNPCCLWKMGPSQG